MNLYNHSDWARFRGEVIKLDGQRCVRCSRGRSDDVVLQVQHKRYIPGRKPWEYTHSDCETLCKGCHAEELGIIMPSSGWLLLATDDLGDLNGNCELCGTALRYSYAIVHPGWGSMAVGTDCCDKLTGTTDASEYYDMMVKDRGKMKRFVQGTVGTPVQLPFACIGTPEIITTPTSAGTVYVAPADVTQTSFTGNGSAGATLNWRARIS